MMICCRAQVTTITLAWFTDQQVYANALVRKMPTSHANPHAHCMYMQVQGPITFPDSLLAGCNFCVILLTVDSTWDRDVRKASSTFQGWHRLERWFHTNACMPGSVSHAIQSTAAIILNYGLDMWRCCTSGCMMFINAPQRNCSCLSKPSMDRLTMISRKIVSPLTCISSNLLWIMCLLTQSYCCNMATWSWVAHWIPHGVCRAHPTWKVFDGT